MISLHWSSWSSQEFWHCCQSECRIVLVVMVLEVLAPFLPDFRGFFFLQDHFCRQFFASNRLWSKWLNWVEASYWQVVFRPVVSLGDCFFNFMFLCLCSVWALISCSAGGFSALAVKAQAILTLVSVRLGKPPVLFDFVFSQLLPVQGCMHTITTCEASVCAFFCGA